MSPCSAADAARRTCMHAHCDRHARAVRAGRAAASLSLSPGIDLSSLGSRSHPQYASMSTQAGDTAPDPSSPDPGPDSARGGYFFAGQNCCDFGREVVTSDRLAEPVTMVHSDFLRTLGKSDYSLRACARHPDSGRSRRRTFFSFNIQSLRTITLYGYILYCNITVTPTGCTLSVVP